MFLEIWMIVVLVLAYGTCAVWNRAQGQVEGAQYGAITVLHRLQNDGIIHIEETGKINAIKDQSGSDQPHN